MRARKLSFRILSVLVCAATILVLGMACDSAPPSLPDGIIHSLEIAPQVPYGETVIVKQTIRNIGDEAVRFVLPAPFINVVVETSDGQHVWHSLYGKAYFSDRLFKTVEPGDEWVFTYEWDQVDNRGEPVPPGTYLVSDYLDTVEIPQQKIIRYWTEALELEVLRPLPSNEGAGEHTRQ